MYNNSVHYIIILYPTSTLCNSISLIRDKFAFAYDVCKTIIERIIKTNSIRMHDKNNGRERVLVNSIRSIDNITSVFSRYRFTHPHTGRSVRRF